MGFGFFGLFQVLFFIAFFSILGLIIYQVAQQAKRERQNDHSPRLTVEAKVVAKRTNHTRHSGGQHHMAHTTTTYFVTFEVASGDRMELRMAGNEYGLLVEGDWGDLTFQGTRYLGFARKVKTYDGVQ